MGGCKADHAVQNICVPRAKLESLVVVDEKLYNSENKASLKGPVNIELG